MSATAGWYTQPDGQQMYWNGQEYTNTWSAEYGAVPNPVLAGEPGPASAQPTWGPGLPTAQLGGKGFFASLFDFGFTSFITLRLLSVIYGFIVTLVLVGSGVVFIMSIYKGGMNIVFAAVGVPIVALIYLILARVSMEMIALFFRIGQNTNLMVASASSAGSHGRTVEATRA